MLHARQDHLNSSAGRLATITAYMRSGKIDYTSEIWITGASGMRS